ncbi:hypothetical protein [Caproiciproducens sp. CPB-2]|uniref:hypothetical protein n=1 Tax=Caproiciproducens sp. CPB-2 TaxID=3030017 RepID=UPI0023DAF788|nr:hypothetical protein [Caproiciproducens sp. CPB-2]MDF1495808.1 hypothetical protein [Caproiciproducens sp. CPB-2]
MLIKLQTTETAFISDQKQKVAGVPIATVYVKDGEILIGGQVFSLHEKITPPDVLQKAPLIWKSTGSQRQLHRVKATALF